LPSRRHMIGVLGFGQLLGWASSYYLLAILAKPMAAGLAVSPLWVYGAFSASLLVAALLGPLAGGLVDKHGGRWVLLASNALFALGLTLLATARGPLTLALGWLVMGVAMPMGLYDVAFATLVRLYHAQARRSIVGVTLIAGFASSVSWPLTAMMESHYGWRMACAMWALLHLTVGMALHYFGVPRTLPPRPAPIGETPHSKETSNVTNSTLWILAAAFTANGFIFSAMATHLPRVLQAVGCSMAAAVAAASLIGVFQVGARVAEASVLHRLHPLISGRIAASLHPLGVVFLLIFGAPAAVVFTALHGAGVGLMTIVKGTLPLALFGAAGFGRRSGLLEAPSRVAQAITPLLFGYWLDAYGAHVVWISGAVGVVGLSCLLVVHQRAATHTKKAD
jgi:MFS family permease